jgi:hypothetical protein
MLWQKNKNGGVIALLALSRKGKHSFFVTDIYLVFFTLLVAYRAAKIITQIIRLVKISPALMAELLL